MILRQKKQKLSSRAKTESKSKNNQHTKRRNKEAPQREPLPSHWAYGAPQPPCGLSCCFPIHSLFFDFCFLSGYSVSISSLFPLLLKYILFVVSVAPLNEDQRSPPRARARGVPCSRAVCAAEWPARPPPTTITCAMLRRRRRRTRENEESTKALLGHVLQCPSLEHM